ncbi:MULTISPECIES: hypothetical protein [Pseudomonas]|uniref:hypothetical protein n=1 Tax=Pseudomonas TaxID=286 RepID=UPI0018E7913C|nr:MULTISPECIES: hypothetical protein [Pseudomonas]MBJ2346992.1 hypothetical protein [Pseudomonas canavaninivorans]MBL3542734.1 hypothetical protein [Pseudomonas sp. HB05]
MNNPTEVKIVAIDDVVEDCMTLLVHGYTVECFVNHCASNVAVGETHQAEITIDYSDPIQIELSSKTNTPLEKNGDGFGYYLYGVLEGDIFKTFTVFPDEDIHFDFPELAGRFVKIEVDRINVNFL